MGGLYKAGSKGQGGNQQAFDPQGFKGIHRTHNVDDGINSAHFVKVHLVRWQIVNVSFHSGQGFKNRH